MGERYFIERLIDLVEATRALDDEAINDLAEDLTARWNRPVDDPRAELESIRVGLRYLRFHLEATRREVREQP